MGIDVLCFVCLFIYVRGFSVPTANALAGLCLWIHSNHLTHRLSHKYHFINTGWSKGIHSINVYFRLLKLKRLFTNFGVFRYLLSMKTILMFSFHIMLQNEDYKIRDF